MAGRLLAAFVSTMLSEDSSERGSNSSLSNTNLVVLPPLKKRCSMLLSSGAVYTMTVLLAAVLGIPYLWFHNYVNVNTLNSLSVLEPV